MDNLKSMLHATGELLEKPHGDAEAPAPTLATLPGELIHSVADALGLRALLALARASRRLHFLLAPLVRARAPPLVRAPTHILTHVALHLDAPAACVHLAQTCRDLRARLGNTGMAQLAARPDEHFVFLAVLDAHATRAWTPRELRARPVGLLRPRGPCPLYTLFLGRGFKEVAAFDGLAVAFVCERRAFARGIEYREMPLATCQIPPVDGDIARHFSGFRFADW